MAAYKISPELKRPAQAKWLSDDYVKFIRMSEHLIERNGGGGVLGFITNHSYLDNATFVDMRRHLLATFDKIYVFDMHGNATKNEQSPDGQPDKNVFDIRQGVSLIVGVRSPDRPREDVGAVLFREKWGSRSEKYDLLWSASLSDREFLDATPEGVPWNFKPQSGAGIDSYQRAFSINDLFAPNGSPAPGIVTTHDDFAISETVKEVGEKIGLLLASPSEREAKTHFRLCGTTQWNYARAKRELAGGTWKALLTPILYRPFDTKMTVYDRNVAVHRRDRVMRHYVGHPNMGIISGRQGHVVGTLQWNLAFVSKDISDFNLFYRGGGVSYPLYLYPDESSAQTDAFGTASRTINFDPKLYTTICKAAGIDPADQAGPEDDFRAATGEARPSEVKVFDYIYGVLHSPAYRETFAEFLKIDFPRIPYPPSPEVFRHVSEKGEQLRRLHLMEPAAIGDAPYPYVGEGDDTVASGYPKWEGKKVYINKDQHFAEVPKLAWDFYIGGYQPAKKWLKDRRGRPLSFDDIMHYQRIVKVMAETDRVMKEIELPWEGE
jgi:predicted helicase